MGGCSLQAAAERCPDGGFDIIAGRSGSGNLANLTVARLDELRNELLSVARNYDAVVIDFGAGVDRTVRQLSGPAGITLVVTTDEPTSLTDAYAFIKVTHATNPNADLRVVVNMASSVARGRTDLCDDPEGLPELPEVRAAAGRHHPARPEGARRDPQSVTAPDALAQFRRRVGCPQSRGEAVRSAMTGPR